MSDQPHRETLDQIGRRCGTDKSSLSTHNYLVRYEPLFAPMRDKPITLLEMGVQFGHSANMWLEYFPLATVHGLDIGDEYKGRCRGDPRFKFWKGSQDDRQLLESVRANAGMFDIVIDDAGHYFHAQLDAFNALIEHVKPGGYYVIEDWWTTYDSSWVQKFNGTEFIDEMARCLNKSGRDYHGKPTPIEPLQAWDTMFDSILLYPGLVIFRRA